MKKNYILISVGGLFLLNLAFWFTIAYTVPLGRLNSFLWHGALLFANNAPQLTMFSVVVAMLFIGHCQSDEFYAPRYEFVLYDEDKPNINKIKIKLLSALRLASFDVDEDHLRGLEEPICTLVPTPILIAHDLSKKVGEDLAHNWISRTYAEFIKMRNDYIKNVAK